MSFLGSPIPAFELWFVLLVCVTPYLLLLLRTLEEETDVRKDECVRSG